MPPTPPHPRTDAAVLLCAVLILASRRVAELVKLSSTRPLTVSEEDERRRGERMARVCERQLDELAEYGVADDRAATSILDWPEAAWWAGFRVPQMAFLVRLGKEQPGLLAEGNGLTVALHADFAARFSAVRTPAGK